MFATWRGVFNDRNRVPSDDAGSGGARRTNRASMFAQALTRDSPGPDGALSGLAGAQAAMAKELLKTIGDLGRVGMTADIRLGGAECRPMPFPLPICCHRPICLARGPALCCGTS